jgi:hypothetical protein
VLVQSAFRRMVCRARRLAEWSRPPPESRSARYPAPRPARRAVWTQGRTRRAVDRRCRCVSLGMEAQREGVCPPRPHARRLGGWWGTSRSDRQAAGVPVARERRAERARPQGTQVETGTTTLRNLLARRKRRALNDARRDGRGGRCPAARSGAVDDPSMVDRAPSPQWSIARHPLGGRSSATASSFSS